MRQSLYVSHWRSGVKALRLLGKRLQADSQNAVASVFAVTPRRKRGLLCARSWVAPGPRVALRSDGRCRTQRHAQGRQCQFVLQRADRDPLAAARAQIRMYRPAILGLGGRNKLPPAQTQQASRNVPSQVSFAGGAHRSHRQTARQLNRRPFRKRPGPRAGLFSEPDRPALQPLPSKRYVLAYWKNGRGLLSLRRSGLFLLRP